MKVILLQSLKTLGAAGSVIEVKNGYANNYLVPKGIAKYATKINLGILEKEKKDIESRNLTVKGQAEQIISKLGQLSIALIRSASDDGRLYGSVTPKDIANVIKQKITDLDIKDFTIDKNNVNLGTGIKFLGKHEIRILLYNDLDLLVNVFICRSEEEAEQSLKNGYIPNSNANDTQETEDGDQNFIIASKRGIRAKAKKTLRQEVEAAQKSKDSENKNEAGDYNKDFEENAEEDNDLETAAESAKEDNDFSNAL